MSTPTIPEPALLVVSVLSAEEALVQTVDELLAEALGSVEEAIGPLGFPFTSFYDRELGSGIRRWLRAFQGLVDRSELARIKCLTNTIEQAYTIGAKRRFNLDPGLLTLGNFVLATGKNNAHRIYLRDGIFADLTLVFRSGSYRSLEWTYPDYADSELIEILNRLRQNYKCTLDNQATQQAPSGV